MSPGRRVSVHHNSSGASHVPERKDTFSIATYNIAHGRGLSESNWNGESKDQRSKRLTEIATTLRTINADWVVLNEVDFDASWSHGVNQAESLAIAADYPYWVEQRNIDFRILFWTWRFGNAVLSKYPIKDAKLVELPDFAAWETWLGGKKRGVVCEIATGDSILTVAGVHLSSRSEALRVASAQVLCDIAGSSETAFFIAGDLNSTPTTFPVSDVDEKGGNAIELFDKSGLFQRHPTEIPTKSSMTFESNDPTRVIDWILIPKLTQFADYQVINTEQSDHRPVVARVHE
ncbi:Endonuclease/Exonuclease/phosphatase family protein [Planctomycetes bacterium CA13]|uniref:Endonuclease/Exonuclease/phosphatase family protein n=2 Tax=Novipirellula herctigrandis TaxID=2527986 RepID=A0A5C5YUY4_9BACT|nr:Endonuclease/Exonuclease/phosphatase family protein [Planctomycetes bacterium CA13]